MVLNFAAFGWHATIFVGQWTLFASGVLLVIIAIVLLKYFASTA
jgi:hypothetical protein